MSKNNVWLVAIGSALVGAVIAGGGVWVAQNARTTELSVLVAQAEAQKLAAVQEADAAKQQLAASKTAASTPVSSATESSTAAAAPTTPTAPAKAPVVIKQFAFIKSVSTSTSKPKLTVDYALMLTGKAAAKAATAHGDESPPPNDYYIVNDNKLLRKLPVKSGIAVTATTNDDGTSDPTGHKTTFAKWAAAFSSPNATTAGLREGPYWLTIKNGVVIKIAQQYLP